MPVGNWRAGDCARRCWWDEGMSWRVALIDSCGEWPGAVDAAAFVDETAKPCATVADAMGHGSRMARLLTDGDAVFELMLGQVFLGARPASAVAGGADLIHMSLGLAADRAVLAAAVLRAVGAGCVVVASAPARGCMVYPAAYPGVIRGTGDARCGPGELSCLEVGFFGGCARFVVSGAEDCAVGVSAGACAGISAGASVGAVWVTRSILSEPKRRDAREVIGMMTVKAKYLGRERRGLVPTI
jgi:hypothetical protein